MTDTLPPLFGINIHPGADSVQDAFERAAVADRTGLDLIGVQDHPYNRSMLDTWTLLSALAARTERVHVLTNVANLPLRPPAMLAKQAASLDVISGGRVELGIGAGAYWQGIEAYGVPTRSPGEAASAFEEALHVLRGMWDNTTGSFTYQGKFYQVNGARPGPGPVHPIRLWTGALGPRMLRITGRLADGLLISRPYVPPERLPDFNARIDDSAIEAGRAPTDIRRGYNLMGMIELRPDTRRPAGLSEGNLYGTVNDWIEELVHYYRDYRQDTFLFWPVAGDELRQIEVFAQEVAPAVREAVALAPR
ncbi:MAG TPA: LLM class flavin-dependent oxidoreductase [Aggregatilinea sp.]|uniref:LLM class flavin-dependent oxidoreductase n=1 Tax=Aggregatilinea sp. TaxID=2806333 RepID=UPI002C4182D7|nr:LLM class flavin-dependent oxidoreductase [Aggregatilinea sp.]HML21923.1 LLM class flavin-dependent oxidoreductase [Aggregatilinea sp.]